MARQGAKKLIYNGNCKLEYSTTESGAYTKIYAIKEWPDPDGDVAYVSTTDMDNVKYNTQMAGLQAAPEYVFPLDLEALDSEDSNLLLLSTMEDSGSLYYWKWTLADGIIYTFQSDVITKVHGGGNDELIGFDLILTPVNEPVRTVSKVTPSI